VCDTSASGTGFRSGRPIEHRRNLLEQLKPAVEGAVVDQVEGNVGIAIEEALLSGRAG
jgi:hypothetical protein